MSTNNQTSNKQENVKTYELGFETEELTPKERKIITWIILSLITLGVGFGIHLHNKEKRLDEKLENFSDAPGDPYQYFETMQVVDIDKTIDFSNAGDGLIRAICKDKNGQLWQLTQDNGACWHSGPSFVNVGDDVIVGTDTSYVCREEYVIKGLGIDTVYGERKHIIADITAKQQAKQWLRNHKSANNSYQKLAYVTGTIKMIDNENTRLFAKCIQEDGKVIIGEAINPTNQDPITNATTGQEVIIEPTHDSKGTIISLVNVKKERDCRIRDILHARKK